MKNERCEWRCSVYKKKERSKQAAKLQRERRHARAYLRQLQEENPGHSLLDLMKIIMEYTSPLTRRVAVEQIELNQKNLSAAERASLDDIRAQLAKQDCPVIHQGQT